MTQDTQAGAGAQPAPAQQLAAASTLERLGYTYRGGAEWAPPLGRAPDFNLLDAANNRIAELEAQAATKCLHQGADAAAVAALKGLLSLVRREAPQLSGKVLGDAESAIAALQAAPLLNPVEPGALHASIRELDAWESRADGNELTPSESESVVLVLHELKRLQAAPPAPAWPTQLHEDAFAAATDMLHTARTELEMLREALGVPVEPHQSLHERMLERAALAAAPAQALDDRAAFKAYLQECDDCEIVPDVAGAFHAAWQKRAAPAQAVAVRAPKPIATIEVQDDGNLDYETSEAGWLLPVGVHKLYTAPAQEHATQLAGGAVAYLDLGAGGYLDIGTDLSDEQLSKLPKGRHMLVIGGTYGVDGYAAAPGEMQKESDAAQLLKKYRKLCLEIGRGDSYHIARIDAAIVAAAPAPAQEHATQLAGQGQDDLRTAALQDSAYAAGMLSGWNLCVADDHATFSKVRGERMTSAARVANAARAAAPAQAQEDAREAERLQIVLFSMVDQLEGKTRPTSGNAPYHGHSTPGVWDSDNGAKAGTKCAWCELWAKAVAMRDAARAAQGE